MERLELIVTYRCQSNCSHCLIQPKMHCNETMDPIFAKEIVNQIGKKYHPSSIMTFGGEPTLALDTTIMIHAEASKLGIPHRQLITNGHWGKNPEEIATKLLIAGVNDIEISLDAFHDEFIDFEQIIATIQAIQKYSKMDIKISPRWLLSAEFTHPLNHKTHELISSIKKRFPKELIILKGEHIQPRGNALQNFAQYFSTLSITGQERCGDMEFAPKLDDIHGICVSPLGEVIICNNVIIGRATPENILSLLHDYNPTNYLDLKTILHEGLGGLLNLLQKNHLTPPSGPFYSICDACFQYRKILGISDICNA